MPAAMGSMTLIVSEVIGCRTSVFLEGGISEWDCRVTDSDGSSPRCFGNTATTFTIFTAAVLNRCPTISCCVCGTAIPTDSRGIWGPTCLVTCVRVCEEIISYLLTFPFFSSFYWLILDLAIHQKSIIQLKSIQLKTHLSSSGRLFF